MAITNRDIEKLKSVFTTKEEFNSFKDQTQSNFDFAFKKLIDIDHELKAFLSLYKRHDETIESHEKRIMKLETAKA